MIWRRENEHTCSLFKTEGDLAKQDKASFIEEYETYKNFIFSKEDTNSVFFIGEPRRMLSIYLLIR